MSSHASPCQKSRRARRKSPLFAGTCTRACAVPLCYFWLSEREVRHLREEGSLYIASTPRDLSCRRGPPVGNIRRTEVAAGCYLAFAGIPDRRWLTKTDNVFFFM